MIYYFQNKSFIKLPTYLPAADPAIPPIAPPATLPTATPTGPRIPHLMLNTPCSSPHYLSECMDQTLSPPPGPPPLSSSRGEWARIGRESPDFSGSSPPTSPSYPH